MNAGLDLHELAAVAVRRLIQTKPNGRHVVAQIPLLPQEGVDRLKVSEHPPVAEDGWSLGDHEWNTSDHQLVPSLLGLKLTTNSICQRWIQILCMHM